MSDDQRGRAPGQGPIHIAIEVDDIRLEGGLELEQPLASTCDVMPGVLHPFELEVAFEHLEARNALHLCTLEGREGAPIATRMTCTRAAIARSGRASSCPSTINTSCP